MLKIHQVAKLSNVTVRALQYYDFIGLLTPKRDENSGYRFYGNEELEKLQQILFFKELGFSLKQIKEILNDPSFDRKQALENHRKLLLKKRQRLNNLIQLVEQTMKGGEQMSFEAFQTTEIEQAKQKYAEEVRQRWGDSEAFRQSEEKAKQYSSSDWKEIQEQMNQIFLEFSRHMHQPPSDPQVQQLVKQWQDFITRRFYDCSKEMLLGLGEMYVHDERFRSNIDQTADGLAEFISTAIRAYCK